MQKYLVFLRDKKLIDFEENQVQIKKVDVDIKRRLFKIALIIKNALTYPQLKKLREENINFFKEKNINVILDIEFENENLTPEQYLEYYDNIVREMAEFSPVYKAFTDLEKSFNDSEFLLTVEDGAYGLEEYLPDITTEFLLCGLHVMFSLRFNLNKTIKSVKESASQIITQELVRKTEEAKEVIAKSDVSFKKSRTKMMAKEKSKICDIPNGQKEIAFYASNVGQPIFCIEAEIFDIEIRKLKNSSLATLKVTDYSDSIIVKKWLRADEEIDKMKKLTAGDMILVNGRAEYDNFAKNVIIMADELSFVGKHQNEDIKDEETTKRVELHCHTKMSNLDGVTDAVDYINQALAWGHKAIAFTDHSGIYAIPDINKACKGKDIKPIFGLEASFIDDSQYKIAFSDDDIDLKKSSFVIFDLETTGFSQEYDKIIEIAAVKLEQGAITKTFSTFVNPERNISQKITELTSITNEMVSDAPKIGECLQEFLDFCEGSIMVAHNASFDMGMLYANIERLNLGTKIYPTIDTLACMRALYANELKRFNLKAMSKFFKVKQEHHHRALDDTRVTAECFIYILQEFYRRDVTNYKQLNSLINPNEIWKHVIPKHLNLLVQTQVGYKNLYKLLSDMLTIHCYGEGRLLKSVLDTYREGILVGSGCVNGNVFELALNGNTNELIQEMNYYDYIEVQPPKGYMQLFNEMDNGEEIIKNTIKKIIEVAKSLNKTVVATSDCHYLRPNLKKYRDILIASPQIGGGQHNLARYNQSPNMHFRTTKEMLDEFDFLEYSLAYEIVVTNTNLIADSIDNIQCFHKEMFAPRDDQFKDSLGIPSIINEMKSIVYQNLNDFYGENPHKLVVKRLERELNSIISNGYSSVYYMSHLLVKKSLEDGYLVGSRGSVGSSLVATMMQITEINPLAPHYRCKKCKFAVFKMNEEEKQEHGYTEIEKPFVSSLDKVESGYDLDDAVCPICGEKLAKDGHDIPFETFLGFDGDKVPDIDLNFSGEYQAIAHRYIGEVMGMENAFRSGTVGTIADKNAFGYVKAWAEKNHLELRSVEIDRIAAGLIGVKRSTGQHPGGIIVVPDYIDIYDVTPIQYPADNFENEWRTTHFDYHSFEDNLLKLDILAHDDPTMIKFFMDYVHEHQEDYPFDNPQDIPIDDKNVYRLFGSTEVIGVQPSDIDSKVASYAVPEFGTNFVRQMLSDTLPKSFAELVKISGLSHGTDVWLNNAQSLVLGKTDYGYIDFGEVIGCRDDIMVYLLYQGLEPLKAFEIMEFVRRGKPSKDKEKWEKYKEYMREKNVPEWYIWSCEQIKYMFPKAHATAYVLMALRIAWFKVYSPILFYSAYFSKRAKAFSISAFLGGPKAIREEIKLRNMKTDATAKDEDIITCLGVALEMTSRGLKFLPVDIMKSDSTVFLVEDGALRIPFIALDGLGESVALDMVAKREERIFSSKKDVTKRTKLNKSLYEEMEKMNAFGDLPEEDAEVAQGLFAFM